LVGLVGHAEGKPTNGRSRPARQEMGMAEQVLLIVGADWGTAEGEKAIFGRAREAAVRVTEVGAERLATQLRDVCKYVGTVFRDASTAVDELELDSLTVQLEITTKGEIRLIGAASTEIKGGLILNFTRSRG
jgi:hypothetical protein